MARPGNGCEDRDRRRYSSGNRAHNRRHNHMKQIREAPADFAEP